MNFSFRQAFLAGAAVALVLGLFLLRLWQPERQIELHTAHLMNHLEQKDWRDVPDFIAVDFHDSWDNDRERLLTRLRAVLGYTRKLKFTAKSPQVRVQDRDGVWVASVKVDGEEGEAMTLIKDSVNSLGAPFELRWRRQSGKPWDWKLISVSNPELAINDRY